MIVSHEHEFVFLKTHKTAGTSIEVLLSGAVEPGAIVTPISPPNPEHEPRNHRRLFNPVRSPSDLRHPRSQLRDLARRRAFYNHIDAERARQRLGPRRWRSYFKFCFERDPWDKTVSAYHWHKHNSRRELTFEEFVLTGPLPSDFDRYSIRGSIAVDFVGRYETLATDLQAVLRALHLPTDAALPREKGGVRPIHGDRLELFTPALEHRVAMVFRREIEAFGYPSRTRPGPTRAPGRAHR